MNDLEDVDCAELNEPDPATPEAALMKAQEAGWIQSAILALPMHYRETLVLREVQGLSYAEIAELTGISIGTTMSRLFRARRQIMAQFKDRHTRGLMRGADA